MMRHAQRVLHILLSDIANSPDGFCIASLFSYYRDRDRDRWNDLGCIKTVNVFIAI